jgi:hypothetical protein
MRRSFGRLHLIRLAPAFLLSATVAGSTVHGASVAGCTMTTAGYSQAETEAYFHIQNTTVNSATYSLSVSCSDAVTACGPVSSIMIAAGDTETLAVQYAINPTGFGFITLNAGSCNATQKIRP